MFSHTICLVCKGPSNDDVGGGNGYPALRETRPKAGFKTGDFVREMLGELPLNDSHGHFAGRLSKRIPSREGMFRVRFSASSS